MLRGYWAGRRKLREREQEEMQNILQSSDQIKRLLSLELMRRSNLTTFESKSVNISKFNDIKEITPVPL